MRRGTEFARELASAEAARLMSGRAREAMASALQRAKASWPGVEPTPDEAFDQLRRASMRRNVKVRDIARGLVEATSAGSPRHADRRAVKRTVG